MFSYRDDDVGCLSALCLNDLVHALATRRRDLELDGADFDSAYHDINAYILENDDSSCISYPDCPTCC